MLISIVVPCYNEEEALPLFKARFDGATSEIPAATFELVFVDDGSRDETPALLSRYASEDARVRVLTFSRNAGKEAALLAGLTHAGGDLVAVMDADLQDPPELLGTMLGILSETGCDCAAARRVTRAGEPPVRSFFARVFYRAMRGVPGVRVVDGARDFRLMRREMVDAILTLSEKRRFSKGLFAWVGFDVRFVEYENVERAAGVTKWSFWALLRYAVEGVCSLTAAPLLLPLLLGAPIFLACLVLLCLGMRLAALLCGATSLALFSIGVLGQYLARAYWEAKRRPKYVIKK